MAKTEKDQTPAGLSVLTSAQLRDAERGLRLVLARIYGPAWSARNTREVLAEAIRDYVVWVGENGAARNPVGWLVERGRLRASNLHAREQRRAGPALDLVVGTVADEDERSPEETALEVDRRRRIAEALSEIPEEERRLIELVYYERLSIAGAGRRLGWGKSNAAERHAKALGKLKTRIGPRDAITPGLLGLLAHESLSPDRRRVVGRVADRLSALVRDVADMIGRALGSATRGAGDVARRAAPLADNASAASVGGGMGRFVAQCGVLAAICGATLIASPPVEHLITPPPRQARPIRTGRAQDNEPNPASGTAPIEEPVQSTATARSEEGRRIERHRRHRLRHARRVKARRARQKARRIRERRRARAARVRQQEQQEEVAAEEAARQEEEAAAAQSEVIEPEAVAPEAESAAPPPATGAQTREEFGL